MDYHGPTEMANLALRNLTKRYPGVVSVDAIDLTVDHGEFVCLLGPSGCGKTTTLRMIAGFLEPDEGEIGVDGATISSPTAVVPPERRNMSMIFQSYAIWPHMTVRQNVGYPLKMKKIAAAERRSRVDALLAATKLDTQAERYPSELSGGQQQRVAIARALANEPALLLADEPTGNLDSQTADAVLALFRELATAGTTIVMATHERDARQAVDRTIVLADGHIVEDSRRVAEAAA